MNSTLIISVSNARIIAHLKESISATQAWLKTENAFDFLNIRRGNVKNTKLSKSIFIEFKDSSHPSLESSTSKSFTFDEELSEAQIAEIIAAVNEHSNKGELSDIYIMMTSPFSDEKEFLEDETLWDLVLMSDVASIDAEDAELIEFEPMLC